MENKTENPAPVLIPYDTAWAIANRILTELAPHCERVQIAGSIRRGKDQVKDLEIVCVPKTHRVPGPPTLFGPGPDTVEVVPGFIEAVNVYPAVKGRPEGKYTQRIIQAFEVIKDEPPVYEFKPEIRLDLFMCRPENWGPILLIRTGNADFSRLFVDKLLKRNGYTQEAGYIQRSGNVVPVWEEKTLFEMVNLPFIEPAERTPEKLARYGIF